MMDDCSIEKFIKTIYDHVHNILHLGNYIEVLHGLNYFNNDQIKTAFENLPLNLQSKVIQDTENSVAFNRTSPKIGHRAAIDLILKYY